MVWRKAMLIIPAIDLKDGKCVRLREGKMDQETIFSSSPIDVAGSWLKKGAELLHIVDFLIQNTSSIRLLQEYSIEYYNFD